MSFFLCTFAAQRIFASLTQACATYILKRNKPDLMSWNFDNFKKSFILQARFMHAHVSAWVFRA